MAAVQATRTGTLDERKNRRYKLLVSKDKHGNKPLELFVRPKQHGAPPIIDKYPADMTAPVQQMKSTNQNTDMSFQLRRCDNDWAIIHSDHSNGHKKGKLSRTFQSLDQDVRNKENENEDEIPKLKMESPIRSPPPLSPVTSADKQKISFWTFGLTRAQRLGVLRDLVKKTPVVDLGSLNTNCKELLKEYLRRSKSRRKSKKRKKYESTEAHERQADSHVRGAEDSGTVEKQAHSGQGSNAKHSDSRRTHSKSTAVIGSHLSSTQMSSTVIGLTDQPQELLKHLSGAHKSSLLKNQDKDSCQSSKSKNRSKAKDSQDRKDWDASAMRSHHRKHGSSSKSSVHSGSLSSHSSKFHISGSRKRSPGDVYRQSHHEHHSSAKHSSNSSTVPKREAPGLSAIGQSSSAPNMASPGVPSGSTGSRTTSSVSSQWDKASYYISAAQALKAVSALKVSHLLANQGLEQPPSVQHSLSNIRSQHLKIANCPVPVVDEPKSTVQKQSTKINANVPPVQLGSVPVSADRGQSPEPTSDRATEPAGKEPRTDGPGLRLPGPENWPPLRRTVPDTLSDESLQSESNSESPSLGSNPNTGHRPKSPKTLDETHNSRSKLYMYMYSEGHSANTTLGQSSTAAQQQSTSETRNPADTVSGVTQAQSVSKLSADIRTSLHGKSDAGKSPSGSIKSTSVSSARSPTLPVSLKIPAAAVRVREPRTCSPPRKGQVTLQETTTAKPPESRSSPQLSSSEHNPTLHSPSKATRSVGSFDSQSELSSPRRAELPSKLGPWIPERMKPPQDGHQIDNTKSESSSIDRIPKPNSAVSNPSRVHPERKPERSLSAGNNQSKSSITDPRRNTQKQKDVTPKLQSPESSEQASAFGCDARRVEPSVGSSNPTGNGNKKNPDTGDETTPSPDLQKQSGIDVNRCKENSMSNNKSSNHKTTPDDARRHHHRHHHHHHHGSKHHGKSLRSSSSAAPSSSKNKHHRTSSSKHSSSSQNQKQHHSEKQHPGSSNGKDPKMPASEKEQISIIEHYSSTSEKKHKGSAGNDKQLKSCGEKHHHHSICGIQHNSSTSERQHHSSFSEKQPHNSANEKQHGSSSIGKQPHSSMSGEKQQNSSESEKKHHSSSTGQKIHSSTNNKQNGSSHCSSTNKKQQHSALTNGKQQNSSANEKRHQNATIGKPHQSSNDGKKLHNSAKEKKDRSSTSEKPSSHPQGTEVERNRSDSWTLAEKSPAFHNSQSAKTKPAAPSGATTTLQPTRAAIKVSHSVQDSKKSKVPDALSRSLSCGSSHTVVQEKAGRHRSRSHGHSADRHKHKHYERHRKTSDQGKLSSDRKSQDNRKSQEERRSRVDSKRSHDRKSHRSSESGTRKTEDPRKHRDRKSVEGGKSHDQKHPSLEGKSSKDETSSGEKTTGTHQKPSHHQTPTTAERKTHSCGRHSSERKSLEPEDPRNDSDSGPKRVSPNVNSELATNLERPGKPRATDRSFIDAFKGRFTHIPPSPCKISIKQEASENECEIIAPGKPEVHPKRSRTTEVIDLTTTSANQTLTDESVPSNERKKQTHLTESVLSSRLFFPPNFSLSKKLPVIDPKDLSSTVQESGDRQEKSANSDSLVQQPVFDVSGLRSETAGTILIEANQGSEVASATKVTREPATAPEENFAKTAKIVHLPGVTIDNNKAFKNPEMESEAEAEAGNSDELRTEVQELNLQRVDSEACFPPSQLTPPDVHVSREELATKSQNAPCRTNIPDLGAQPVEDALNSQVLVPGTGATSPSGTGNTAVVRESEQASGGVQVSGDVRSGEADRRGLLGLLNEAQLEICPEISEQLRAESDTGQRTEDTTMGPVGVTVQDGTEPVELTTDATHHVTPEPETVPALETTPVCPNAEFPGMLGDQDDEELVAMAEVGDVASGDRVVPGSEGLDQGRPGSNADSEATEGK